MEDTGLVHQDPHYSRARTCCQVEVLQVLQVPLDLQDLQARLVQTYLEEELQGRRSIQAWEAHQVHNCSQEGRDHRDHLDHLDHHHQVGRGLQEDLVVWLRPSQREEPDLGVGASSGGFGWSPPSEQASSGSGVAATGKTSSHCDAPSSGTPRWWRSESCSRPTSSESAER